MVSIDPLSSLALRPDDDASAKVWDIAAEVPDPEVPVLTIADLGVLRDASFDGNKARVVLTPTYSGCPAIDHMRNEVAKRLLAAGYEEPEVCITLSPAWTTDWMSEAGKQKLEAYGIAPPVARCAAMRGPLPVTIQVKCPRCHSLDTKEIARFGSTSCKALYECRACLEPFDYFKMH